MENPLSRPAAAQLINKVIQEHQNQDQKIYGWSLCMKIYDALVKKGYLTKE